MRIEQMHWGQVTIYRWQDRLDAGAERYLSLLRSGLDEPAEGFEPLVECLNTIRAERVEGDLVHCGAGEGDAAFLMRGYTAAHQMQKWKVWVAVDGPKLDEARAGFERLDLLDGDQVQFLEDWGAPEGVPVEKVALLRIGADAPVTEALEAFSGKLVTGGFVLVEDAGRPERREAVECFHADHGGEEPLETGEPPVVIGWRKVG
jgi:hypothetical protein